MNKFPGMVVIIDGKEQVVAIDCTRSGDLGGFMMPYPKLDPDYEWQVHYVAGSDVPHCFKLYKLTTFIAELSELRKDGGY